MTEKTFKVFSEFIETNLGIRMPPSKRIMLEARLSKRVRTLGLPDHDAYCEYVFSKEGFDREIQQLIDAVTTNETDFFRESHHFDLLTNKVLPEFAAGNSVLDLNVWSVAASTGQESYTIAMVLEDFARTKGVDLRYRILGTDISEKVLRVAETGIYTERQAAKIPQSFKRLYCLRSRDPEEKTIRIRPELRARTVFRQLNLMDDSYNIKRQYQIVFCRNVFIYFDRPTQRKVLARLYGHLAPGGYLFMGHSENIGSSDLGLKSVASSVYRKTGNEEVR